MAESALVLGDCLDVMKGIPDNFVDMVMADPPYGTTACKWDFVISPVPMWEQLKRIVKPTGAIAMTASQPFTTTLINSNIKSFKYEWIWEKSRSTGFLQSGYMPMKSHENVLVFCFEGVPTYNPQKTCGHVPTNSAKGYGYSPAFGKSKERNYGGGDTDRFPRTVQRFKSERGLHTNQKPVPLMEYMIKTYTDEGQTVLDFSMGSGTTGVACKNLGRRFIGIERDPDYFKIAQDRINSR